MWHWVQDFTGGQFFIEHKVFILGICGPTCSGKTAISLKLLRAFKEFKPYFFPLDMYYKSLPDKIKPEEYNFDSPEALDFKLIMENLKSLIEGREFQKPVYDFKTHKRISYKKINKKVGLIIMEGIFLFYFKSLRNKLNFKVFLEAREEEIYKRRIRRDKKLRGSSLEFIKNQLQRFVFPANKKYVEKYKNFADIILPPNFSIEEKVDIIFREVYKNLLKYGNEF